MELDKHKDHTSRSDLAVASWTYFEDLWRHKKGKYWLIRGQLGVSHAGANPGDRLGGEVLAEGAKPTPIFKFLHGFRPLYFEIAEFCIYVFILLFFMFI